MQIHNLNISTHLTKNFHPSSTLLHSKMFAGLRTLRGYAASGNMEQLMKKLNNLNKAAPAKEAVPTKAKAPFKKSANSNSKYERKQGEFKGKKGPKRSTRNNNSRTAERKEASGQRRGNGKSREPPRTVSQYDRFRNPKNKKKTQTLNSKGDQFAQDSIAKAAFIKRKSVETADFNLKSRHVIVDEFVTSVAKHSPRFAATATPFAKFYKNEHYQLEEVNKAELELSKDKFGYDTKSRMLRALDQLVTKRGFKLTDGEKVNFQYLPFNSQLYPFANTTLPSNLMRNQTSLKTLGAIPESELQSTISSVVFGKRPMLKFDPTVQYKTEQLRVNAQVVINSLNNNAQLQVDGMSLGMAPVLLGDAPVKTLPQAVLAPKKI